MYTHYVSAHFAAFDVIPEWPDDVTHTDHTKIHIPKESLLPMGFLGISVPNVIFLQAHEFSG